MTKIIHSFSTTDLSQMTNVPPQTINYWVQTELIAPSVQAGRGRGRVCRWNFQDAVAVRVIASMRAAGLSLQGVRQAVRHIQRLKISAHPLSETFLLTDGKDAYLVDGDSLVSMLKQPGQAIMRAVFGLGDIEAEIRPIAEKIVSIREAQQAA